MTHLHARLCLAALACTATIACEDEGPDSTTDADTDASGESGESDDTGDTGDTGTSNVWAANYPTQTMQDTMEGQLHGLFNAMLQSPEYQLH